MSFLEHLDELRKRLINIVYSLIAGCVIAFIFIGKIFDFIMRPMQEMLPPTAGCLSSRAAPSRSCSASRSGFSPASSSPRR